MEAFPENAQEREPASVGRLLAEARKSQGLSVPDVAQQLRLSVRQVAALEADDYGRLPGNTFVRGFVRNYAKLLRLDAQPLLARLSLPEEPPREILPRAANIPFPSARSVDRRRYALALLLLVAVGLAVFELYHWSPPQPLRSPIPQKAAAVRPPAVPQPAPSRTAPEPAPAAAPAGDASSRPAAPEQEASLRLSFQRKSWVEVTDRDGKRIFSKLNPAGSEQVVTGRPPLSLVVGNARYVTLEYNGKRVDLAPYTKVDVARLTLE